MINLNGVELSIDGRQILHTLSLKIEKREKCVIFGPSGGGKSSLLKSLIGIYRPQKGVISISDMELNEKNIGAIRQKICYVPQFINVFENETVRDFIYFPFAFKANSHLHPEEDDIFELFTRMKLNRDIFERETMNISGGERQRIALVRGVLLKREVFILDEITSAIDEENRRNIMDFLFEAKELTIVAVSHDREWIRKSSRQIKIEMGRVESSLGS